MRLPTPLLRRDARAYKNNFGHLLVLAGSPRMLGAACLTGLSALRAGAGLVTLGVPRSLNLTAQKKSSCAIMTWPLAETPAQTISPRAAIQVQKELSHYQAIAIGPGLSRDPLTQKFAQKIITAINLPMVIDADALFALASDASLLKKGRGLKILTPHEGEMARLIGRSRAFVANHRQIVAKDFAKEYRCLLLLKGPRTIIASADGKVFANTTGNVGLATAGSGDVLTGIIGALLAQGVDGFEAGRFAAYLHGRIADVLAHQKPKASIIATDLVEGLPDVLQKCYTHR